MPNELKDIEVDEVSLVDRPATGRRFTLFKRVGAANKIIQGAIQNICSNCAGHGTALSDLAERIAALENRAQAEALAKRDDAEIDQLRELARTLETRLTVLEKTAQPRQSTDPNEPSPRLWGGLL